MCDLFEIKICGINDETCMTTAINYKVNYIGLVFYDKSPRNITIENSKKLLNNRTKDSKIVALTVDPNNELIMDIKDNVKPDYIQLHGNETPKRCKEIRDNFDIPIIKGIGLNNKLDLIKSVQKFENYCDIILLDAPSSNLPGGNGKKLDWTIFEGFKLKKKWMLAGGLNLDNISEAIKVTNPPAIDISSGLELERGIKSPHLIKEFLIKCKNL